MPNTVRLHRVLAAKPEKVYRAFLEADALAKWLPPNGFACTVHQRASGQLRFRRRGRPVPRPSRRSNVSDPRTGGCLCGAIRYETVGEPVFTLRCHCRDCQRQSGAAHVPAARVPSAGFRLLQGTPKRYLTKADSGNDIVRVFCGNCGTPLYVQVGTRPDIVGLRVCTLDDPSWFKPDADIFMKSAQPWDHDLPDVPKHDTYPPGQSYQTALQRGE